MNVIINEILSTERVCGFKPNITASADCRIQERGAVSGGTDVSRSQDTGK